MRLVTSADAGLVRPLYTDLGSIEHGGVVIACGPLFQGFSAAVNAGIEDLRAIGSDFDRLTEVNNVRRKKSRRGSHALGGRHDSITGAGHIDTARTLGLLKELIHDDRHQ